MKSPAAIHLPQVADGLNAKGRIRRSPAQANAPSASPNAAEAAKRLRVIMIEARHAFGAL